MGYVFDGSSQSFQRTSVIGWSAGSLWFKPHDDTRNQALMLDQNTAGTVWRGIYYRGAIDDKVSFGNSNGDGAVSSGTVNVNEWNHVYWSFDVSVSPDEFRVSLNGEAIQTGGAGVPLGATSVMNIARRRTGITSTDQYDGVIAELALYNGIPDNDGDWYTSLSQGFSPHFHRFFASGAEYLEYYWPFLRHAVSHMEFAPLDAWTPRGGPPLGEHPRIFNKSVGRLIA